MKNYLLDVVQFVAFIFDRKVCSFIFLYSMKYRSSFNVRYEMDEFSLMRQNPNETISYFRWILCTIHGASLFEFNGNGERYDHCANILQIGNAFRNTIGFPSDWQYNVTKVIILKKFENRRCLCQKVQARLKRKNMSVT